VLEVEAVMRIVCVAAVCLTACGSGSWVSGHWTIEDGREGDSLDLNEADGRVSGTFSWGFLAGEVSGAVGRLDGPLAQPTNAVRLAFENRVNGAMILLTARASNGDRHLLAVDSGAFVPIASLPKREPAAPIDCWFDNSCSPPLLVTGVPLFEATKK
jgi:hypothetical protein